MVLKKEGKKKKQAKTHDNTQPHDDLDVEGFAKEDKSHESILVIDIA